MSYYLRSTVYAVASFPAFVIYTWKVKFQRALGARLRKCILCVDMEGDSSSLKHSIIISDIGHPERKRRLYVIDEIGEMGLYSKTFTRSMRALLRGGLHPPPRKKTMDPITVMATFPVSGQTHKLLREVKSREDCILFEVCCFNMASKVTV